MLAPFMFDVDHVGGLVLRAEAAALLALEVEVRLRGAPGVLAPFIPDVDRVGGLVLRAEAAALLTLEVEHRLRVAPGVLAPLSLSRGVAETHRPIPCSKPSILTTCCVCQPLNMNSFCFECCRYKTMCRRAVQDSNLRSPRGNLISSEAP